MRQALRWWFERQVNDLEHQSEIVHNTLMQDIFAVRRSVEITISKSRAIGTDREKLKHLERIYLSLSQVGDTLSPAYVRESLPLAIQSKLSQWSSKNFSVNVELHIPRDWHYEVSCQNHLIIYMVDELLRIAKLAKNSPTHLNFSLQGYSNLEKMSVALTYSKSEHLKSLLELDDLRYLQRTFNILSYGKCCYSKKNITLYVQFQWRSRQMRHIVR